MNERREPSIRVMLMPRDTNGHGTIFGGAILSHLDIAGAVEARKHTSHRVVTAAIDKVEFIAPVNVGDLVSYYTRTMKTGVRLCTWSSMWRLNGRMGLVRFG